MQENSAGQIISPTCSPKFAFLPVRIESSSCRAEDDTAMLSGLGSAPIASASLGQALEIRLEYTSSFVVPATVSNTSSMIDVKKGSV